MSANPYYPVTTSSDSAQLTDDDWGLSFSSGRKGEPSRFKSLYRKSQGLATTKCALGVLVAVVVLIFICVIIAVLSRKPVEKAPTSKEPARVTQTTGLNFFPIPEDGSILMSFAPHQFKNDEAIKQSMDAAMADYEMTNQLGDEFVTCNSTFAPFNKVCKFTKVRFGPHCSFHGDYGYGQGQACVLIQLELPSSMKIGQITKGSRMIPAGVQPPVPLHPSYIPITCQGKTGEDQKVFGSLKEYTKSRVEFYPEEGFQSFLYRARNESLPFVKPAVMAWFPSLPNRHVMHITCTAWGQLYDLQDRAINHSLLQTSFAFYLQFGTPQ